MSELARQLKEMIMLVDGALFPETPLEVTLSDSCPVLGGPQFGFFKKGDEELYYIHVPGIEAYFEHGRQIQLEAAKIAEQFNFTVFLDPEDLVWQEVLPYCEKDAIAGAAFHEVRHRIQLNYGVTLFNVGHTDQVERFSRWGKVQSEHFKNHLNSSLEFDAKFFECYGMLELKRQRLHLVADELRNFLLMTPYWCVKREKKRKKQ